MGVFTDKDTMNRCVSNGWHIPKYCIVFCVLSAMSISCISIKNSGETTITNGLIQARIYLPDANTGYYRGVRFDWSGVIASLEYKGHHYFGQWFNEYNPTKHDAIMGPVEAFDPIGFDGANSGENFVKIGVGELKKTSDSSYIFMTFYPIINSGKWEVKMKKDHVRFSHKLKAGEYSYEYFKTVQLLKDKPIMILRHTLKNTGKRTIETEVYNHNFFVIDKQPTGPGFEITLPFSITEKVGRMEDYAIIHDNKLIFLKDLNSRNVSFKDLTSGRGSTYDIKVDNHNTGAGVRITGNQVISKLVFWSAEKTVCPEPYIKIKVEPGKEFSWDINYEFYSNNIIK